MHGVCCAPFPAGGAKTLHPVLWDRHGAKTRIYSDQLLVGKKQRQLESNGEPASTVSTPMEGFAGWKNYCA